jgi:hypothetical protein
MGVDTQQTGSVNTPRKASTTSSALLSNPSIDATLPRAFVVRTLESVTGANKAFKVWEAVKDLQTFRPRLEATLRQCESVGAALEADSNTSPELLTLHSHLCDWCYNVLNSIDGSLRVLSRGAESRGYEGADIGIDVNNETRAGIIKGLTDWEQRETPFLKKRDLSGLWSPERQAAFDKLMEAAKSCNYYTCLISGLTSAILEKSALNPAFKPSGDDATTIHTTLRKEHTTLRKEIEHLLSRLDDMGVTKGGWHTNFTDPYFMNAFSRVGFQLHRINKMFAQITAEPRAFPEINAELQKHYIYG